jgi:hypothetical protein
MEQLGAVTFKYHHPHSHLGFHPLTYNAIAAAAIQLSLYLRCNYQYNASRCRVARPGSTIPNLERGFLDSIHPQITEPNPWISEMMERAGDVWSASK